MEHIPFPSIVDFNWLIMLSFFLLLPVLILALLFLAYGEVRVDDVKEFFDVKRPLTWAILPVMVFVGLSAGFVAASFDHRAAVERQIQGTYGDEYSAESIEELRYPRQRPEGDFEVFGSTHRNVKTDEGFTRMEVFLVWQDGKLMLAQSTDGENFEPVHVSQ